MVTDTPSSQYPSTSIRRPTASSNFFGSDGFQRTSEWHSIKSFVAGSMDSGPYCVNYIKPLILIVTSKTGILKDRLIFTVGGYLVYDSSSSTRDEDFRRASLNHET